MVTKGNGTLSADFNLNGSWKVCVYDDRNVGSDGVWFGDDPFQYVLPVTLFQVFLLVTAAQVLHFVLRPLRTPKFVCSAMGGLLLGSSFLGHNKTFKDHVFSPRQAGFLVIASALGVLYSIFLVSLKMDVSMTLKAAKRTWRLGVMPFLFSFLVMTVLFYMYRPHEIPGIAKESDRIFFSATSSFANFPVISQALLDLNLITSELGQIALSSAMLNDVLNMILVIVVYILRAGEASKNSILPLLICHLALICSCLFVVRPALLMIARRTPVGKPIRKAYVVLILVGVLVMAVICDMIGLSFLHGAVLFGLIMPNGPPLATTIIDKTEAIVSEFFLPLCFAYIGISTNFFEIQNWGMIMKFEFILTAGYLAKVLACMLVSLTYKIRLKHGLVLGLILNIKGIVEIITYARLKRLKVVDDQLFSYLILSSLVLTAILTPLIEFLYKPHTRLDDSSKHHNEMRTIQNTSRNSEFRIISCVHDEGNVRSSISVLEACKSGQASPICAYVIHLIELLGKSTPFLLPADRNRRKSSSVHYPNTNHIMRAFENYSSNSGGLVAVQPYINVAPYKNMHEAICNLSQDKLVPLLIIPFHENDKTHGSNKLASIRNLNANFQAYAPCTVGILVDRYSQLRMRTSDYSFHVGIFFTGGADDREALALGIRMSEYENTRITLFCFVLKNKNEGVGIDQIFDKKDEDDELVERILDESFVDEFKAKSIGNNNLVWRAIMVEDSIGVMEAIRGLEGNFDLVMVGRRQDMRALDDLEMSNFMENVEMLGMLGDMLASAEFCNGMVPTLVIRCGGKPITKLSRGWSMSSLKSTSG